MFGEEDVPEGEFVGVWTDGHGEGSKRGWLDDWDLGFIGITLIGCRLGEDLYGRESGEKGSLNSDYGLRCLDG